MKIKGFESSLNTRQDVFECDELLDFLDNWSKFSEFAVRFLDGESGEFKWVMICGFMSIQSGLILRLGGSSRYGIIEAKWKTNLRGKVRKFRYDLDLRGVGIKVGREEIAVSYLDFAPSDKGICHELCGEDHLKSNVNCKIDAQVYKHLNRLKKIDDLWKTFKKLDKRSCGRAFDRVFNMVKGFRDNWVHFEPKGWLIELDGAEDLIQGILEIVVLLIDNSEKENRFSARSINLECFRAEVAKLRQKLS